MNQITILVVGGVTYWKRRMIGRRGSIQTEPGPGDSIMISRLIPILIEGNDVNHESQNIPSGVETHPHGNYQVDSVYGNPLEETLRRSKDLTRTNLSESSSELLLDNLKVIIHESQQETFRRLNELSSQLNEMTKGNINASTSMKRNIKNIEIKIKKVEEKRILGKTEYHECRRRLQCIEQKVRKSQFN